MTTTPLRVSGLEPVGLSELDDSAALQIRKDRKYLVPVAQLDRLVGDLDGAVRVLEIDRNRTFRYESVYFDTPDLDCYLAAAHRRPRRFKVRIRTYLDSGLARLEVKHRRGRGLTVKHRCPHVISVGELTPHGRAFLDQFESVAAVCSRLRPTLTTRYFRTTLLELASTSRITIDTGLECIEPGGARVSLPGLALVETKSRGKPIGFDHMLWASHLRPVKISKYCTGLAALDPGLPANKWNRVLQVHFGRSPGMAGAVDLRRGERRITGEFRPAMGRLMG